MQRRLATLLATCAMMAAACLSPEAEDQEKFGVVELEFNGMTASSEVNVSNSFPGIQGSTLNPSMAWIRTPNNPSTGSPEKGHMLTAYTRKEQASSTAPVYDAATWAVSTAWTALTPMYSEFRANEWVAAAGSHRWPAPDNLCDYYGNAAECGGSVIWNTAVTSHWREPAAALWTGLDRGAAIVTTGGGSSGTSEAVFVVASDDGGLTFRRSLIVSIEEGGPPTLGGGGEVSGGNIIPGSVHASLAWYGERTSHVAGQHALPIDIVWLNDPEIGNTEWWWTRVAVGEGAQIAQITHPRKLPSVVPRDRSVHVSVFAHRVNDEERVSIAWSERGDAMTTPPESCASGSPTTSIAWYAATTSDMGDTWDCFQGNNSTGGTWAACSGGQTTIATSANWPICLKSHPTSPIFNNDRPEVVVNAPADLAGDGIREEDGLRYFYFAVTKNSGGRPAACVYRTGSVFPLGDDYDTIELLANSCTPATDPSSRAVTGSSAQALSVAQGTFDKPRVQMIYRNRIKDTVKIRYDVMDIDYDGFAASTTTSIAHLSTQDVDLDIGSWGLYSALSVYEKCDPSFGLCPADLNFAPDPQVGFAAAWSDTRRSITPKVTDTWTRSFQWQ